MILCTWVDGNCTRRNINRLWYGLSHQVFQVAFGTVFAAHLAHFFDMNGNIGTRFDGNGKSFYAFNLS